MLAVGASERHALFGDAIDVGTVDIVASVATQFGAQVVNDDKEDIGFLSRRAFRGESESAECHQALFEMPSSCDHLVLLSLERELHAELDVARRICGRNGTKAAGGDGGGRRLIVDVIERVLEVGADAQPKLAFGPKIEEFRGG